MTDEVWKDIPGFEGRYQASTHGRIRSYDREQEFGGRYGCNVRKLRGRIIKPHASPLGYLYLALFKDTVRHSWLVHRLILLTFNGPSDLQVNHKNGVKADNRLENLEYCTSSENLLHCTRVLGKKIGERHGRAKLKADDIPKIRSDTRTILEIACDYGVTTHAIWCVKNGRTWARF
jgi:hypothetical protein